MATEDRSSAGIAFNGLIIYLEHPRGEKTLFWMELWPRTPARSVKKRRGTSDFGICGAQRATIIALGSYSQIDFSTGMALCVLGGLWYTLCVRRLEL